jgi:hypothetical protein
MELTKSGVVGFQVPLIGSRGHAGQSTMAGIEWEWIVNEESEKSVSFACLCNGTTNLPLIAHVARRSSSHILPPSYEKSTTSIRIERRRWEVKN